MVAPRQLTQLHRRQQLALRKTTLADMARLWPALDWADLDATYPDFAARVGTLVGRNRRNSAGLAARYLRAYRVASGLDGDVRIVIPETLPGEQFKAALHSTSVAALKSSASRGVDPELAMSNARTVASGAMSRLVLNAGREAILEALRRDDKARGYRRVVGSGACNFCREIAGSGTRVYNVDASFDAHGKCGCTSEPVYE